MVYCIVYFSNPGNSFADEFPLSNVEGTSFRFPVNFIIFLLKVPFQEKEHKKKCLLPDNGSLPTSIGGRNQDDAAAAPAEEPVASESRQESAAQPADVQPSYQSPRGGRQQQHFRAQQQQQRHQQPQQFVRQGRQQFQNQVFRQGQFAQRTGQQQPRNGRQFQQQQQSHFRG